MTCMFSCVYAWPLPTVDEVADYVTEVRRGARTQLRRLMNFADTRTLCAHRTHTSIIHHDRGHPTYSQNYSRRHTRRDLRLGVERARVVFALRDGATVRRRRRWGRAGRRRGCSARAGTRRGRDRKRGRGHLRLDGTTKSVTTAQFSNSLNMHRHGLDIVGRLSTTRLSATAWPL